MIDLGGTISCSWSENCPDNFELLHDNEEVLILFYWDGESERVQDVDYFLWGGNNHAIDKTGKINSISYAELLKAVINFSFFLKSKIKNKKIKKIMIHSSASIESSISILACCRLGIIHNVIFEDLEGIAIEKRIQIFKPDVLISKTSFEQFNKKILPVVKKHNIKNKKNLKIIFFTNKLIKKYNIFCTSLSDIQAIDINRRFNTECKKILSNQSLFVLFTSGSTGTPKGIVHSTGGYLTYTRYTCARQFGYNQNSVVMTASDAGWINGHTYSLYGPLMFGATSVLLESPILLVDKVIMDKIIKDLNTTILYLPVTLIRIIKSLNYNKKAIISKITTLGSMGESLAPEVAKWYSKYFNLKNKSIINTYFQTETGGIISSPLFSESIEESPHGTVGKPLKNLELIIKSKKFSENIDKSDNEIKIKNPWPGCMKGVLNGNNIWKKYWDKSGYFKLFDTGNFDKSGNLIIHGRTDDVMSIRGHRIGSAEIESVLLKINYLIEVCAVGVADSLEGSLLVLFVVCNRKLVNLNSLGCSIK